MKGKLLVVAWRFAMVVAVAWLVYQLAMVNWGMS